MTLKLRPRRKGEKGPALLSETTVFVDLYSADVSLVIGPKENLIPWFKLTAMEHLHDLFVTKVTNTFNSGRSPRGVCFSMPGGGSVVWLEEKRMDVFIHEISHAVYHMLQAKGINLCEDTDEVYAYAVEYLFRKLNPFKSCE